jgi:hypothetical protein
LADRFIPEDAYLAVIWSLQRTTCDSTFTLDINLVFEQDLSMKSLWRLIVTMQLLFAQLPDGSAFCWCKKECWKWATPRRPENRFPLKKENVHHFLQFSAACCYRYNAWQNHNHCCILYNISFAQSSAALRIQSTARTRTRSGI